MTSTHAVAWGFRLIAWTIVAWFMGWTGVLLLAAAALVVHALALTLRAWPDRPTSTIVLGAGVALSLALLASTVWPGRAEVGLPVGVAVFTCHAISYLVDVRRGIADPRWHVTSLLYLLQLPVFPVGPLSRFHEFAELVARADVSMAGFSYGVRRIVQGLTKVYLIAGPLGSVADRIFDLRVTKLSIDAAWLGPVCVGLQIYFYLTGFSDVGIGLGKMVGLRYQENFRRPYTADSIREFWRRWNVTLVTWLRDYAALPIAGHEQASVGRYGLTIFGFLLIGLWTETSWNVLPWAIYSASWLAIEALGLGVVLQRVPRALRHVYVLLVVVAGWVILRASGPGPLLGYVEAMLGSAVAPFGGSGEYLTPGFVTAFVCAVIFAGPLVSNLSRWRVSVDSAVASLLMMFAATGILLWHLARGIRRLYDVLSGTKRTG